MALSYEMSCLSCQQANGLLTPPSSLPSSLPESMPDDLNYLDRCSFCKRNQFDIVQNQREMQSKVDEEIALAKHSRWLQENTYRHSDFSLELLSATVARKNLIVTVIVPAREVASTIGGVLEKTVKPLVDMKIVSNVYAIDCNSKDGTGAVAAAHGATVIQRAEIAPELGPSKGKGDAMWRSLLATSPGSSADEIIAFLDGDTGDPTEKHLIGIVGPLIMHDGIQMVRGCFERPFKGESGSRPNDGGRVTELAARPMLNLHFPELSVFSQPLAGEFAARRGLLEQLAFPVGYGIEIGTLIDASRLIGRDQIAESHLGSRQNDHKALRDLSVMSFAVISTLERRLARTPFQDKHTSISCNSIPTQIYLPWTQAYCEVSAAERQPIVEYLKNSRMMLPHPPFVEIDGVKNLRDAVPDHCGRHGLVYRSADFGKLTAKGLEQLQELRIAAVFDLRSKVEVEKAEQAVERLGNDNYQLWTSLPGGPKYIFAPIFEDEDYSPEALLTRFRDYAREGTEGFERAYGTILANAARSIRAIINHLDSPTPKMLIHCTAGKDRTGVIVMVLLLLAGCSPKSIADEYALTDIGLGDTWKSETASRLMQHPAFEGKDINGVERMISARNEVMMAVIRNFERDFGSAERYLATINVGQDQIQRVKAVLQEPHVIEKI